MKLDPYQSLKLDKRSAYAGWSILILGLLVTALASFYVSKKNRTEDHLRFEYESNLILRRIQNRMEQYEGVLIQTRAFLLNAKSVNRLQLQGYFNDTQIFKRYPGLQGLGYSLMLPDYKLNQHLKEMRKSMPDYRVWPMTKREIYSSIIVLEPSDWRNKKAIGFDMYQEPVRRKAMDEARDKNMAVMSNKVILVQEIKGERYPGFNLYLPHYVKNADLSNVENRRKALIGYIYSPFRSRELFDAIFTDLKMTVDIEIFDGEKIAADSLIYDFDKKFQIPNPLGLSSLKVITISGRTLLLRFAPLPSFRPSHALVKVYGVFIFGTIMTMFIFWIFLLTKKQIKNAKIVANDKARLLEKEKEHVMARDDFLSIASHELKTPLTSLKLQAQVMKRAIDRKDPSVFSPEKVSHLIHQIDNQTTRLNRLVDDMLDISRIRTGRLRMVKEPTILNDVVSDVVERLKHQFMTTVGQMPTIETSANIEGNWDRFRIEQVLTNLLTNALRYGNQKPVTIRLSADGEVARVSVIDQGIGIAPENITKIFERFERAGMSASEVSGLGLGLYITNQIVKAHGGSITVESRPGEGSIFTVSLPV